jgi:hypothetical protein
MTQIMYVHNMVCKLGSARMVSFKLFCAFESSAATTFDSSLKFKLSEKCDGYCCIELMAGQLHRRYDTETPEL